VWVSFHETDFFSTTEFVGFDNYAHLFGNGGVLTNAWITLKFAVLTLALALPAGLGAALLLERTVGASRRTRAVLLLPWIMSQATAAAIWMWFLNPDFGPVSYVTQQLGLGKMTVLSSPTWAIYTLVVVTAWWTYPFAMLFFIGALQTVPGQLYESALIDGAGYWQSVRYVTLPFIRNTTVVVTIVLLMLYVNMVTMFVIATGGGPAGTTKTLSLRIFLEVFQEFNLARAATASVVMLAINAVLLVLVARFRRREAIV
jgi:ABC-type sugar transport system permease subunit